MMKLQSLNSTGSFASKKRTIKEFTPMRMGPPPGADMQQMLQHMQMLHQGMGAGGGAAGGMPQMPAGMMPPPGMMPSVEMMAAMGGGMSGMGQMPAGMMPPPGMM